MIKIDILEYGFTKCIKMTDLEEAIFGTGKSNSLREAKELAKTDLINKKNAKKNN